MNRIDQALKVIYETLAQKTQELKSIQTKNTSYNIGGNFYQVQSGKIELVFNWVRRGDTYTADRTYDLALQVGTACGNALTIVKDIQTYIQMELNKAGFDVVPSSPEYSWIACDVDGERILIDYSYGSAFCTVTAQRFKISQ